LALRTQTVDDAEDVREFFDRLAPGYRDRHCRGNRLLRRRLRIIEGLLEGVPRGSLLEIGCGTGLHLFPLARGFERACGIDLSPAMIEAAERVRRSHDAGERITLAVERAEDLRSIDDASMDAVLCVGAFEHMLDRRAVLREVRRVLRRGGAFVCLTPNADWIWYANLAPLLGIATTHLSTDRFVGKYELIRLLEEAELNTERLGYWSFIPRGDMPAAAALALRTLDIPGRALRVPRLRGGLFCRAIRM
jgi:2-polyprenyl-6-hydroxyphenyl methylase/3-demethylubiquinone-9 3-methyltransferase